MQKQQMLIQ